MKIKELLKEVFDKAGKKYFIYRAFAGMLEQFFSFGFMLLPGLIINEL